MGKFNSSEEIINFAIGREMISGQFYRDLAGQMENTALRLRLEGFADEEDRHRHILELELIKRGRMVPNYQELGIASEDIDDVETLASEVNHDYQKLLEMGMVRERQAFRLYVDLAGLTEHPNLQDVLLLLAEEEARHRALFEMEYHGASVRGANG